MAVSDYATLDELKTHLGVKTTAEDTELSAKLTAASRRVDRDCGRRFYVDDAPSSRTFNLTHETLLLVDDFSTEAGLVVEVGNGTAWTTVPSNQYRTGPQNNLAEGKALYAIERINSCWPIWWQPLARVTAVWGWPSVPDGIKAATLLVAARLFVRKNSIEGVKGVNDLGVAYVARYDPDYDWLINPYIKSVV